MMEEEPKFKPGDRVYVGPLKMEATVIQQQKCWDYPDWFWGNVELQYDDGLKGVSNSWQLKKLTALDAMASDGGYGLVDGGECDQCPSAYREFQSK